MHKKPFVVICKLLFIVYFLSIAYLTIVYLLVIGIGLSINRLLPPKTSHLVPYRCDSRDPTGRLIPITCREYRDSYLISTGSTELISLKDLYTLITFALPFLGMIVFLLYIVVMIHKIHKVASKEKIKYVLIALIGAVFILLSIPIVFLFYLGYFGLITVSTFF